MIIRLKLMGVLQAKSPPDGTFKLVDGSSIESALAALDIDASPAHVITVNGGHVRDRTKVLNEGDELMVLPPVGGG